MTGGPPTYVSSDDDVDVKAVGPRVSEGGGEREGLTGTEGGWQRPFFLVPPSGDREGEVELWWMEVAALVTE